MLTQAMGLFFQPLAGGGGAGAAAQLVGTCRCGGMLQVVTDASREPPLIEIKCTAAAVGGCGAGVAPMRVTPTIREFQVRSTLRRLADAPTYLLSLSAYLSAFAA